MVEDDRGDDQITTYRPALNLTGNGAGSIPVVAAYTNGPGSRRLVEAINAWLTASR
ncbi:hypothetical protein [Pseudooceanicola sp.]|uniref:hypothetical protein n=1 Tax=Pseudooceanicola sp. TaxID=1914328 RepID=UPI0026032E17|nr:hypothetical protein [Pseudooceanicola sp.]MDF1856715.1 hypothetical protein [Pseudooceanicola sp.]